MANSFNIPWFMFDLKSFQLITSPNIPSTDITDNKKIVLAEHPVPGKNFDPVQDGGRGNRKISFTIPLIKRNNDVGNILLLKQVEVLRNNAFDLLSLFSGSIQFGGANKVLFHWGTGASVPQEYYVSKCDIVHRSKFVNRLGYPQYSDVSFELILDEASLLYEIEKVFRTMGAYAGTIQGLFNTQAGGSNI